MEQVRGLPEPFGVARVGHGEFPKVEACAEAAAAPEVVAGALWANLHGIAQLWGWGSLQLATGLADPGPLLQAAADAHLGPAR